MFKCFWVISLLCLTLNAKAMSIEIFTDEQHLIDTTGINGIVFQLYSLDQLNDALRNVNQQVQKLSRAEAKLLVHQWLQKEQDQLKQGILGLTKAQQLNLRYLPAIVFDRRYIIYGQTQLKQAIWEYQQWLKH